MAFVPIRGLSSIADVAKAARLARESIGKVPGVGIELEQLSLNKLKWMASGGRDFRAVTDVLISKMDEAFTAKLMLVMKGKAAISTRSAILEPSAPTNLPNNLSARQQPSKNGTIIKLKEAMIGTNCKSSQFQIIRSHNLTF